MPPPGCALEYMTGERSAAASDLIENEMMNIEAAAIATVFAEKSTRPPSKSSISPLKEGLRNLASRVPARG
jgi:hypothetical protein